MALGESGAKEGQRNVDVNDPNKPLAPGATPGAPASLPGGNAAGAAPADGTATTPGTATPGQVVPATPPAAGVPGATPGPTDPGYVQPPSTGLSDITQRLLSTSAQDMNYLRGEPYSTTEEQAMRERMQSRIRNQYDQSREYIKNTLGAQQGMSGVLAGTLGKLSSDEAAESSGVDRDLMVKAADEQRSRLAESRGLVGGLESLENQRMMQSLGISQSTDDATRQRLLDLMNAMGMGTSATSAGDIAGNLLKGGTLAGESANVQSQQGLSSLSSMASILSKLGIGGGSSGTNQNIYTNPQDTVA